MHAIKLISSLHKGGSKVQFHIVIDVRGVFAPMDRIYKPLIEKPRDYLDSNLFLLTRWENFAVHSGPRFCKFDFCSFTRAKNVTLTFQGHGM